MLDDIFVLITPCTKPRDLFSHIKLAKGFNTYKWKKGMIYEKEYRETRVWFNKESVCVEIGRNGEAYNYYPSTYTLEYNYATGESGSTVLTKGDFLTHFFRMAIW